MGVVAARGRGGPLTRFAMTNTAHIGTSGWSYSHWKGPFYPADAASRDLLAHYIESFDTAEINNTFYQLPERRTLTGWRRAVSEGFEFSVKASRYITHQKKLKDPATSTAKFFDRIEALGDALGPVLFQLPGRWSYNGQRLAEFLEALPHTYRYAFELRDTSWINDAALELLAEHNAAFCIYELDGFVTPSEVTADFVYIRLHGPDGPYQGKYDTRTLRRWAKQISRWTGEGLDVYCYFDNDEHGYAPLNAAKLSSML